MIRFYWNEEWKEILFPEKALRKRYAISNYGRVISFTENFREGNLIKGGCLKGYKTLPLRPYGVSTTYYVHKLVAEYFLPSINNDDFSVIHMDFNKGNNFFKNLKWATRSETYEHQRKNPMLIESKKKNIGRNSFEGPKLNATQVMRLKKKLLDPNRKTKLRILARQFGISEMQLHRIKKGENWSHVEVTTKDNTNAQ